MELNNIVGAGGTGAAPTPDRILTRSRTVSEALTDTPDSQQSTRFIRSGTPASSGASPARRDLGADVASAGSGCASAADVGSASRPNGKRDRVLWGGDRVDSLNSIHMLQWYIIAQVGMEIQLGKINHRDVNYKLMHQGFSVSTGDGGVARKFSNARAQRAGQPGTSSRWPTRSHACAEVQRPCRRSVGW